MPLFRSCRTALRSQGIVPLIVCLGYGSLAAATPLAPPAESAGLAPVAELACSINDSDESFCGEMPNSLRELVARDRKPISPPGEISPVIRAQSHTELLPLASGPPPVETTSLLRWVTGTKGRVRADYLTDFNHTDRIGIQALTEAWFGIGLDAEANYWQRPEPLWTGDVNAVYNFLPHPRFKFRSGLGAAWTLEDGKPHAGYNITHGLDVYLLWRAMFTAEADWGKIDDDDLFRYRLALGLTFSAAEIYSGYESYKLGGERLDGWVNGIAIWY